MLRSDRERYAERRQIHSSYGVEIRHNGIFHKVDIRVLCVACYHALRPCTEEKQESLASR
jgi:hypothetical protein